MDDYGVGLLIRLHCEEPMRPVEEYSLDDFRKMYHQSNYWWAAVHKEDDAPLSQEVLWRTLESMYLGPISPADWYEAKENLKTGSATEAEAIATLYAVALGIRTRVGNYVAPMLGHADWATMREAHRREREEGLTN